MEERRFLSPGGMLFCGGLLLGAAAVYLVLSLAPQGTVAVVESNGQVVLEQELARLEEPETRVIAGEDGVKVTIQLDREGAAVIASTCPDQVCVQTGKLTRTGEAAICLPARVTLRLEGGAASVDATVY